MQTVLLIIHVLLALSLIGLVLIQRGKGAEIGAAFGSGASSTVFGSRGSASFLTRATAAIATLFFVTSLTLAYLSGKHVERKSVTELVPPEQAITEAPATEKPAAPEKEAPAPSDVPTLPEPKQTEPAKPTADGPKTK